MCCGNHALYFSIQSTMQIIKFYSKQRERGHQPINVSTVIRTKIYVESKEIYCTL